LDRLDRPPSSLEQSLFSARAAGLIDPATPLSNPGNQLEASGHPRVKGLLTADWQLAPLRIGASVDYVGRTRDTTFLSTTGVPWPVSSLTLVNAYGEFLVRGLLGRLDLRWRLGVRNL